LRCADRVGRDAPGDLRGAAASAPRDDVALPLARASSGRRGSGRRGGLAPGTRSCEALMPLLHRGNQDVRAGAAFRLAATVVCTRRPGLTRDPIRLAPAGPRFVAALL